MREGALPILTFHAIEPAPSPVATTPGTFRQALRHLRALGWATVDLAASVAAMRRGIPPPAGSFALTFDDGYRSVYEEAFPVLQELEMRATLFVITGERAPAGPAERLPSWRSRPMLSWAELAEMQRAGMGIGAHTRTHPDLTRLPPERLQAEMAGSRRLLEDALGVPVPAFAYPFGRLDRRSHAVAREHFACACSDLPGVADPGSDPWALERIDARLALGRWRLAVTTSRLLPAYARAWGLARRLRRAVAGLAVPATPR